MKRLILVFAVFFGLFSCKNDESIRIEKEVDITFSISKASTTGGRTTTSAEPKSVLVTIKDNSGAVVADRKELALHKFGSSFLSLPLTLKTSGEGTYLLTEFLVTGSNDEVVYITPREGSEMAHLVADALDIEFSISKEATTTITPEVIAVDGSATPESYGYGQFGFSIVNPIEVTFSSFIKSANGFELTNSHLKIEGLSDSQPNASVLWSYETDLEAKANVLSLKRAAQYRITTTKQGYDRWTATKALSSGSSVEMILEEQKVDVYVAGYHGGNAAYWKNGVLFTLPKMTNYPTSATSIHVYNDVYVTGYTGGLPLYWKNGVANFLSVPSGTVIGETDDVIVREDGVHICGSYVVQNKATAAYWKNGVRTDLQTPSSFTNARADKMTIVGSDVYISGYVLTWNTSLLTAAIWKNGVCTILPRPSNYTVSRAEGVKVSNGHVYVSGYIVTNPYPPNLASAVYWVDGVMNYIDQPTRSTASRLDVVSNDVYIPYNADNKAYYMKNGQKILIDDGAAFNYLYELIVSNNDVYIAGTYKKNSSDLAIACYWVNGRRVHMQSEGESQGVSCFVVRGN
jgi:hypothetical protein